MKKLLISLILALTFFSVKGQNVIDSLIRLKAHIENAAVFDEKQYSETVNSLIFCYMNISDYYKAKKASEDGINFLKSHGATNDQPLRTLICYSGLVEYSLKNYVEAMNIFAKVEQMCRETNSLEDEYIIAMCNAALICGELQQYSDMKNIMDAAVANYESKYGSIFKITDEKHFILVNNYGVAHYYNKDAATAEKCYNYVIDNCKGTFESNNALPLALINYSTLLIQSGKLTQAANLLKKARTLNTDYAYMLAQNLVLANFGKWKIKQTAETLSMYNDIAIDNIVKIFGDFPSLERENYWNKISMEMMALNNFIAYFHKNNDVLRQSFDISLFCRNLLLNSEKIIENSVHKSSDLTLQNEFAELKSLKEKFIFHSSDINNPDALKSQITKKEENIIHNLDNLGQQIKQSSKVWEDVKNSLENGEYAIEYSLMYAPKDDGGTDTIYCMIVVGKNFPEPKIEFSTSIRDCDNIFLSNKEDPFFCNEIYKTKTMALYKILFHQIEQYLPDAHTIYYSPCGKLSQLNFDLFEDDNGTPLNKKYKMLRVSSTAEIPNIKSREITTAKSAILFGDIDYATADYTAERGRIFGRLNNSKPEIDKISQTLTSKNIAVKTYEQTSATEESFKRLSGNSPEILHLSTHGFSLETEQDIAERPFAQSVNTYSQKESAMALSGLALSGANNAWKGNFDLPNVEDGILTAYEISQLDLSNTKLVVLSACETARGKIFPVDGVFGLQRAFKQAGAGAILMSLWEVYDDVTATFMEYFYKFLFETNDRHKALKMAQDEVRKQHPDPYYWAAWVMLD